MSVDRRPVRRFTPRPGLPPDLETWPASLPAVGQVLTEGFDVPPGVTVVVGENASGKSTLLELMAVAVGLNPEGGSTGSRLSTRASEPREAPLVVERSPGGARWSYFLRAETLHGLYTYLERNPPREGRDPVFHEMSHGQGLLALLGARLDTAGFFLLDEPDAPLSFHSALGLVTVLYDLARVGAQVVVATHSPLLAATPGATVLEVGEWGLRPARWEELDLVATWRAFLAAPDRFLHHVTDG